MKITQSSVSNKVNFGYDKKLNAKLVKRLEASEQTPVIQTLYKVNENCNFVEDKLRQLERGRSATDKNEAQINILLDYFMDAKTFLCLAVNRLFPDLNFIKKECDGYDKESIEMNLPPESEDAIGVKRAYMWREMMVDGLSGEIDALTSYVDADDKDEDLNPPDYDDYDEEEDYDFREVAEEIGDEEYLKYLDELKQESEKVNNTSKKGISKKELTSDLVEKFIPQKNSPKSLDDVVGLDLIREDIKDLIIYPIEHPEEAKEREEDYGIEIPHFIVFHGPPGCGKTMLAQAIAAQTGCEMYSFDLSKIGSSFVNETTRNVGKAMEFVEKQAKKSKIPVILFMDEMDSVLAKRLNDSSGGTREDNKMVNALLTSISNAKDKNIMIIGATNMFDIIDPAVKRRVDLSAYIGLPNKDEINELLKMQLSKIKKAQTLANDDEKLKELSKELLGYSPSNIVNIIKAASKIAYKAQRELIKQDISDAIKQGSWEKVKEQDYIPQNKKSIKKMGFNS